MFLITITDNNTRSSYRFKTNHGTIMNDKFGFLAPNLKKEMLRNDNDIADDQNLVDYYKDKYNISIQETHIDGRGKYARTLDYFTWFAPLEAANVSHRHS